MVGITKLLCGSESFGDKLRYVPDASEQRYGASAGYGPVVVWNCTNQCNLNCKHCYANSKNYKAEQELSTNEAKSLIDDLAKLHIPVLLISGGEPLMRDDIFEIINYANKYNIRITISTNGTLIDRKMAKDLKKFNVSYVGISLDGIGSRHDDFRGCSGSFNRSLEAIRNCLEIGQKAGLRFTINRYNYDQLNDIFHLIQEEKIPRVCFYHLAYSGRGTSLINMDITKEEKRAAMDLIMKKTIEFDKNAEILTVDNHADNIYLYLQSRDKYPILSDRIWKLIQMGGGNRSGIAIANIDYKGNVHADQFSWNHIFGNIRETKFSELWTNPTNPIAIGLRDRKSLLKGRCGKCQWLNICNGNLRVRAEAVTGDFWASDPACYLSNEEIGVPDEIALI
ncbi:putative heme d1 biosynthesis radical SAM protein NirJ1 [Anaerocolumna sedimenticola]|uniref:Mycofactocin maturase MftC n=1 Tax=Anaerocolumna sedimenticola TaxID=2696063 RepID=A0A6P1TRL3_9FIRM|nr:putative heme d1 biosynthesis radical SAM protein NirJ1 [Anaerocolumna sedimenticola]QHQ63103.1 putative heme d1 biosynthesis radical SAM protein NirJ1 [Anaerocolumna sedimenticola]